MLTPIYNAKSFNSLLMKQSFHPKTEITNSPETMPIVGNAT